MSESMTLLYPESVLMSVTPETIEGTVDARESRLLLGPCCPRVTWDHGDTQHRLLPRAMSESMSLLRPVSWVVSIAPFATKGSADIWDLGSHLGTC